MSEQIAAYCLKYADTTLPKCKIFSDCTEETPQPITFSVYLIVTKDKMIMVDAGCDNMPRFVMKKFYSPAFVLRQLGWSPDEITDVVITHAHHDHIEAVRHFENAVIHITEEAYERGKLFIPEGMNVHLVGEEYVLADGIKMIKWSGHAAGSAIVEVPEGDKIHIFAGDECYTSACLERKIATGNSVDPKKSQDFVDIFSSEPYAVHTCHDWDLKTERLF